MKNTFIWLSVVSILGATALADQPAQAADLYVTGCAKYAASDFQGAKQDFLGELKAKPTDWKAYYQLANCYVQLKEQDNARKAYQDCLKRKPSADIKANCDKALAYLTANSLTAPPKAASVPVYTPRPQSVAATAPTKSGGADDDRKSAAIERRKAQIMADAEIQVQRIQSETKEKVEDLKRNANTYYKFPDGSVKIEADPEQVSQVQAEGEQRCSRIMEDAKRHAAGVTAP